MCYVNSVLLRHHSLRMMVLSGLLTCVDVCSFSGITAQVNTLHLGLWGLFSKGHTLADISVCVPLPLSVFLFLPMLFYFALSLSLFPLLLRHKSAKITLSVSVFLSPLPTSLIYSLFLLCSQLSPILIGWSSLILLWLQTIQPVKYFFYFLPCFLFVSLFYSLLYVFIILSQGDDWILPSSQLTLRKVRVMDEGQYTCMAEHPSVESLSKRRTISITVLPGKKRLFYLNTSPVVLYTDWV